MNIENKNGLEWKELYSELVPLKPGAAKDFSVMKAGSLKSIMTTHFPKSAFFVAWLDYTLLIGRWENAQIQSYQPFDLVQEEAYIQQLRVFNQTQELLVRRTSEGLKGRLRQDNEQGAGTEVAVAHQVLFGTRKGDEGNERFTEITEDRGTSLILPFSNLRFNEKGRLKNRICIKTYNYIDYNKIGQASYVDCRFVCFTDGQHELKQERREA